MQEFIVEDESNMVGIRNESPPHPMERWGGTREEEKPLFILERKMLSVPLDHRDSKRLKEFEL